MWTTPLAFTTVTICISTHMAGLLRLLWVIGRQTWNTQNDTTFPFGMSIEASNRLFLSCAIELKSFKSEYRMNNQAEKHELNMILQSCKLLWR